MATTKHRDPELEVVVEKVRARLAAVGGMRPPRIGAYIPSIPVEAREIVRRWLDEGGYERALEVIAVEDPDLADQ
jgi:hypothetical protein